MRGFTTFVAAVLLFSGGGATAQSSLLTALESSPPAPILDPFAGRGTTLWAAKELGRNAIGIEREERFCEIAAKSHPCG